MQEITLAKSFVYRKDLTTYVRELMTRFNHSTIEVKSTGENQIIENEDLPDYLYVKLLDAQAILHQLLLAIDTANNKDYDFDGNLMNGRGINHLLNLKRELYKSTTYKGGQVKKFTPLRKEYDDDIFDELTQKRGRRVEVEYKLLTNYEFDKIAKSLKTEIRNLENLLSEFNYKQKVVIDDEVFDFLENEVE